MSSRLAAFDTLLTRYPPPLPPKRTYASLRLYRNQEFTGDVDCGHTNTYTKIILKIYEASHSFLFRANSHFMLLLLLLLDTVHSIMGEKSVSDYQRHLSFSEIINIPTNQKTGCHYSGIYVHTSTPIEPQRAYTYTCKRGGRGCRS